MELGLKGVGKPSEEYLIGKCLRIAIVHTRWNSVIVDALVRGTFDTLVNDCQVPADNIKVVSVPGSWELAAMCEHCKGSAKFDAIVAIGCLIKGETMHFEYISEQVSSALMRLSQRPAFPVIYGVLNVLTEEQALHRAGLKDGGHNHAKDWAIAAVEMANKLKESY